MHSEFITDVGFAPGVPVPPQQPPGTALFAFVEAQFNRSTKATHRTTTAPFTGFAADAANTLSLETHGGYSCALIRPDHTNLVGRTKSFDHASWTKVSCTMGALNGTAPDGTATADTITLGSSTGGRVVWALADVIPDNGSLTIQCWVRSATSDPFRFSIRNRAGAQVQSPDIPTTPTWTLYTYTFTDVGTGGGVLQAGINNASTTGTRTYEVSSPSVFAGSKTFSTVDADSAIGGADDTDTEDLLMWISAQVPEHFRRFATATPSVPRNASTSLVSGDVHVVWGQSADYCLRLRHNGTDIRLEAVVGGVVVATSAAVTWTADQVLICRCNPSTGQVSVDAGATGTVASPWEWPDMALRLGGIPGSSSGIWNGGIAVPEAA